MSQRDTQAVAQPVHPHDVPLTDVPSTPLRGPVAAVARALDGVQPRVWMWRDGLTVIGLDSRLPSRPPDYLTFDDAAAGGAVEVTEAAAQAVPAVEATTGPMPVLILGGDTLLGGAQNRIINVTILLKAAATTRIPVSCLELGRWNDGRRFAAARPVDHAMRRMVAEQVSRSSSPAFAADQGAIWAEIGQRQARAAMRSPTEALHDVYARDQAELDAFATAFPIPAGTRGIAIGLYDRLAGLDLFDSAETLERQWPRLVASAASALLDARRAVAAGLRPAPRHRHLHAEALSRMLARARAALAGATVTRSPGQGSDVRFATPKVTGTALVHDRRAIHLALFRPAPASAGEG